MKNLLIFTFTFLLFTSVSFAQTDSITISQEEAQTCASRALEAKALREEVKVLEQSREDDKKSLQEITDLKNKFMTELIVEKRISAEREKQIVRLTAIIEFLLKNGRTKCKPFSVCIGN